MPTHAKFNTLPKAIKDEIIKRILSRESYEATHHWLLGQHGVNISVMALNRSCKPLFDNFIGLVDQGMPIDVIIKNRAKIEAIGIDKTKQLLIDKLAEKPGSLFAYLDEMKNPPAPQTQLDKIKADLLGGGRVDSVTAFSQHCITRLAAIIKRLRDKGWPIVTDQAKGNGIAHYSLPEGWRPEA